MTRALTRAIPQAQPSIAAPLRPDLPEVEPLHTICLDEHSALVDAAFSTDGSVLYALLREDAVNVWGVALSFWPEVLAVASSVWVLVFVLLIVRALRRRPRDRELRCGRCEYPLSGLPDGTAQCPECGIGFAERRPVRGARLRRRLARVGRRLAPLGATMLLLPGILLAMRWLAVPRSGLLSDLVVLPSRSIGHWIETHDPSDRFQADALERARIVAFDVATGTGRGTVWEGPDAVFRFSGETGECYFISEDRKLVSVDLQTGRGRRVGLLGPLGFSGTTRFEHLGVSPDRREYFIAAAHDRSGLAVVAIDLDEGSTRTLFTVEPLAARAESYWNPRSAAWIVPGEPARFVVSHYYEHARGGLREASVLRVYDRGGSLLYEFTPSETVRGTAYSANGEWMYLECRETLDRISLHSGVQSRLPDEVANFGDADVVLPGGHTMRLVRHGESADRVLVRINELGTLEPTWRLVAHPGTFGIETVASPDGSAAAVVASSTTDWYGRRILILYKLPTAVSP